MSTKDIANIWVAEQTLKIILISYQYYHIMEHQMWAHTLRCHRLVMYCETTMDRDGLPMCLPGTNGCSIHWVVPRPHSRPNLWLMDAHIFCAILYVAHGTLGSLTWPVHMLFSSHLARIIRETQHGVQLCRTWPTHFSMIQREIHIGNSLGRS